MRASSPITLCSLTETFGASHAFFPTRVPPPKDVPAITNAPFIMWQLCATCTRLSIFTSSSITVSPSVPRSMAVFAPTYTLSPIITFPKCGKCTGFPAESLSNPNPLWPITTPDLISQSDPITDPESTVTDECSTVRAPILDPEDT